MPRFLTAMTSGLKTRRGDVSCCLSHVASFILLVSSPFSASCVRFILPQPGKLSFPSRLCSAPLASLLTPPLLLLSHIVQATVPTSPRATAVARPCLPLTSPCSTEEQLFPVHTHTQTNQPSAALWGEPAAGAVGLLSGFIITVRTQQHAEAYVV